jgi:hypothetical protein
VSQTSGTITGNTLTVSAATGINLPSANQAVTVHLYNSGGSGNISYANSTAFTVDALNRAPGNTAGTAGAIDISITGTTAADIMSLGDLGSMSYGSSYSGIGLKSNNGNIAVTGDRMDLDDYGINAANDVDSAAAMVTIRNFSPGEIFTLGGSSYLGPQPIFISDIVLGLIRAGSLEIGRADLSASGEITVQVVPTIPGCTTLALRTGAGVVPLGGGTLPIQNLAVQAGLTVELNLTDANQNIAVDATITALSNPGGDIILNSASANTPSFTIASIPVYGGSISGLKCADGGVIALTAPGAVVQQAAAPVIASATASPATGSLALQGAGSYTLTNTGNDVSVLAAGLTGDENALAYTDANGFSVGMVTYTPSSGTPDTVTGIEVNPGSYANGALSLIARSGALTVDQVVYTGGGSASLTGGVSPSSGSIAVNAGIVTGGGTGGTVTLTQAGTGTVTINADGTAPEGFINSSGGINGSPVTITAAGAVSLTAANNAAAYITTVGSAGTGGAVTIDSAGAVTLNAATQAAYISSKGSGAGGGGAVTITTTAGGVTLAAGSGEAAYIDTQGTSSGPGGNVVITAAGAVALNAAAGSAASIVTTGVTVGGGVTISGTSVALGASGSYAAAVTSTGDAGGGAVGITATAGGVTLGADTGAAAIIDTRGTSSGPGGNVVITAAGAVALNAAAGHAASVVTTGTAAGGAVNITGASVALNAAAGAAASVNTTGGTAGGAVSLSGGAGGVTLNANGTNAAAVTSAGGTGGGGAVTLGGTGNVSLAGGVTVNSGSTSAAGGNIIVAGPLALIAPASAPSPVPPVSLTTGPAGGNIAFNNTVNGPYDLSLTAGTGTVTFTGAVGNSTRLGDGTGHALTVNSASAVLFNSTLATESGLNINANTAGTKSITFAGNAAIGAGASASDATYLNGNVTLGGDTGGARLAITAYRDIFFGDSSVAVIDPGPSGVYHPGVSSTPYTVTVNNVNTGGLAGNLPVLVETHNHGNAAFNGPIAGTQNLEVMTSPNTGSMSAGRVFLNGHVTVGSSPRLYWSEAAFKVDAARLILASGVNIATDPGNGGHDLGNVYLRVDGLDLVTNTNSLFLGTWPNGGNARVTSRNPAQAIEYGDVQRYEDAAVAFFNSAWHQVDAGTYTVGDPLHTATIYVTGVASGSREIDLIIENGDQGTGIIRFEGSYYNSRPLRLITTERIEFEHLDFGSGSKESIGYYPVDTDPLVVDLGTAHFAVESPILLKGNDTAHPTTLEIRAQGKTDTSFNPAYNPAAGIFLNTGTGITGELAGNNRLVLNAGPGGDPGNIPTPWADSAGDHWGDIVITGTSSLGTAALPLGDLVIESANDLNLEIPVYTAPNAVPNTGGAVSLTHSGVATIFGDLSALGGFEEKAGAGYEVPAKVVINPGAGNAVPSALTVASADAPVKFGEEVEAFAANMSLILNAGTAAAALEKPVVLTGAGYFSRPGTGSTTLGAAGSSGNIATAAGDIFFGGPLVLVSDAALTTAGATADAVVPQPPSPPYPLTGTGNVFLNGASGARLLTIRAGDNAQRTFTLQGGEIRVNQLVAAALTQNNGIISAEASSLTGPADPADPSVPDSAFTPAAYAVRFVNDYTGASPGSASSGVLNGGSPNTYIVFEKNLSAGSALPEQGTGWLVFLGNADQAFENNTGSGVRPQEAPNVLIYHNDNATGVILQNHDVLQRGNQLVIRRGFLDLAGRNWRMVGASGSSAEAGFHGLTGRLTLGYMNPSQGGARLFMNRPPGSGGGFKTAAGFTMNALGQNEITSIRSVDIHSGTAGINTFRHVAFVMNVFVPENFSSPPLTIRNLSISGHQVTPQNNLVILEDVFIRNNGVLNGTGRGFEVGRNWNQNFPGARFEYRNSSVRFTGVNAMTRDPSNNPVPPYITISGNTTWWDFICETPRLTIRFSSSTGATTSYHYVGNLFRIWAGSDAERISLSRDSWPWTLPWPDPPTDPWPAPAPSNPSNPVNELERTKFWDLLVESAAGLELQNVDIYYNYSRTILPIPLTVQAAPFLRHFCFNWLLRKSLIYSFTEDADGNGRIDRIRVQSSVPILNSPASFQNLQVEVPDYEIDTSRGINGFARAGDSLRDALYIYLREKDYEDGEAVLRWRILSNTLVAERGNFLLEPLLGADGFMPTIDTVPPRVTYALTLPEKNELFIQLSEPMVNPNGGDLNFVIPGNPVVTTRELRSKNWYPVEFLLTLTNSYKVEDLAAGNLRFTFNGHDRAARAVDLYDPDDPSDYPSPKYPVDWSYRNYVTVRGSGTAADPFRDEANRPIRTGSFYAMVPPNWLPPESPLDRAYYHRLTDVLISLPPENASDSRYFFWPLWAKDNLTTVVDNGRMWGEPQADFGVIWDFTGAASLQDRDIVVQARMNDSLTDYRADVYFASRVPDVFRARTEHGPLGLWLPPFSQSNYVNIVPRPYTAAFTALRLDAAPRLFNYHFSKELYSNLSQVDFFFQVQGGRTPLFAARLDMLRGGEIPSDWYRRVKPFSFLIHDITLQRSGVTILNNVIDPGKGEKTYIDYKLNRNGRVTIQVFTLDGTMVRVLQRGSQGAGEYRVSWDGKNRGGRTVARGMYFVRVVGPEMDEIRKVMVVR